MGYCPNSQTPSLPNSLVYCPNSQTPEIMFDEIRPYHPEELPEVYERLLADKQFLAVLPYVLPDVPVEQVATLMRGCKTNLEFQKTFCYGFLKQLLAKASTGCDMDISAIDNQRRYTFVSNHRDIVLDSALLDMLLIDANFSTTCEIAIGDNLLSLPWVRDLVRVNKSFIVQRSLPPRQMLLASRELSDYMHYAISEKNENIWIAQREGRAKDSDDRTQPAILKMMAMGGEGTTLERLEALHIVPLAISYEYDPCDYLKARELWCRHEDPAFRKTANDDVVSMRTGIMGYKGAIHYHCAPCIDDYLQTLGDVPKGELFDTVAAHIDRQIHLHYRLFSSNLVALRMLGAEEEGNTMFDMCGKDVNSVVEWLSDHLSVGCGEAEEKAFNDYLSKRVAMAHTEGADDTAFIRHILLVMYANPAINFYKSLTPAPSHTI